MDKLFGVSKKKAEEPKPDINAPTLADSSNRLDQRGKVIQGKVDDCNKELADLKK